MSQDTVEKQTSLKDILAKLRETDAILETTESRLGYLATNTPLDTAKSMETPKGESATLEALNIIANQIGRKVSNIAGHTNTIVGN